MSAVLATRPSFGAKGVLLLLISGLFLLSGSFDPDYESYRFLYENGGGFLEALGRDPAFVYVLNELSARISYEAFRYLLCAVFAVGLWKLGPRLGIDTALPALFLLPIVALKFHVQIREGLALLIWLFALSWPQIKPVRFGVMATVSSAIHLGVLPMWAALIVHKRPFLILLFFVCYGVLTTAYGRDILTGVGVAIDLRDTGLAVEITDGKVFYWSLFVVLPLLALWAFRRIAYDTSMGRIAAYGLLGFFPTAALVSLYSGAGEGEFANILRVANTLIALLGVQLAKTRPRKPLTWAIGVFATADALRLLVG